MSRRNNNDSSINRNEKKEVPKKVFDLERFKNAFAFDFKTAKEKVKVKVERMKKEGKSLHPSLYNYNEIVKALVNLNNKNKEEITISQEYENVILLCLLDNLCRYGCSLKINVIYTLEIELDKEKTVTVKFTMEQLNDIIKKNLNEKVLKEIENTKGSTVFVTVRNFAKKLSNRFANKIREQMALSRDEREYFQDFNLGFLNPKDPDLYTDAFSKQIIGDLRYEKLRIYLDMFLFGTYHNKKISRDKISKFMNEIDDEYLKNRMYFKRVAKDTKNRQFFKLENTLISNFFVEKDTKVLIRNLKNLTEKDAQKMELDEIEYNNNLEKLKEKEIKFKKKYNSSEKSEEQEESEDQKSENERESTIKSRRGRFRRKNLNRDKEIKFISDSP